MTNQERAQFFARYWAEATDTSSANLESCVRAMLDELDRKRSACTHSDTVRIGEIGGRFGDEWCKSCGALRSWDNYVSSRERAVWSVPEQGVIP